MDKSDERVIDNDFRRIPVFPTAEELLDTRQPAIQSNVIKGKYQSVDNYLDIQYRLLREDFVRPLRRGLKEYLNCGQSVDQIHDIYVYEDVKFESNCQNSFNAFWMRFDVQPLKDVDWKSSERLFFGSLVCLSSDHFQTFIFGTISGNRFEDNLIKGLFQMKLEFSLFGKDIKDSKICINELMAKTYSMVESKAYFEAYRHTLLALQRFNSDNFPLQRFIIDVNTNPAIPSHLSIDTVYNFSHLIVATQTPSEEEEDVEVLYDKLCPKSQNPKPNQYKCVPLFEVDDWPTTDETGLDDSQYEAFRRALLNQLVLIQGPPGCGKTYIGLKIVETLHVNKYMHNCPQNKPILIVCYTNHALDQFLEGILVFCKSIIRIGGGSKSEALKKYTLRMGRNFSTRALQNADIIGMTTTGAAKFRQLLEEVDPRVVIIEEAAEVLESHVITSLTKSTQHLILIGDHKQLRPQTADYELSKDYNLNISLFERLIGNGMGFSQLKLQHRMRPEISGLITPHIYEVLFNHKSVYNYENIRGLKKNMFFLNHSQSESSIGETMSKTNEFEAKFIVRLARHLIYQNYDSTQITILSLYSSQYYLIKRLLREDSFYDGLNVEVLDSFQGEENDIILLSFVRSNGNNEIGFLRTANRVNVALSRAKKALYCVGNFDCLSKTSDLWKNIYSYLKEIEAIGPALDLICPNHPKKLISVSNARDFDQFPFGGCLDPCVECLPCGHRCPYKTCHSLVHNEMVCKEKCLKLSCDLNHKCQKLCHFPNECRECTQLVVKRVPECGHEITEVCSGLMFCNNPCDKLLGCGHKCHNRCGDGCQLMCKEEVERVHKECGHKVMVKCFDFNFICHLDCEKWLKCGHKCNLKCSEVCAERCVECMTFMIKRCQTVDWTSDDGSDSGDH